jgi:hypothetical protein
MKKTDRIKLASEIISRVKDEMLESRLTKSILSGTGAETLAPSGETLTRLEKA